MANFSISAAFQAAKLMADETGKVWYIASYGHKGPYLLLDHVLPTMRGSAHPGACECEDCVRFYTRKEATYKELEARQPCQCGSRCVHE